MREEIKQVVFVTHPTWPMVIPRVNPYTGNAPNKFRMPKNEIEVFAFERIMDYARKMGNDTLFVVVKTASSYQEELPKRDDPKFKEELKAQRAQYGLARKAHRKAQGIEKKLIRELEKIANGRVIVASGKYGFMRFQVKREVDEEIKRRGIRLAKPIELHRTGAWEKSCAYNYPNEWAIGKEAIEPKTKPLTKTPTIGLEEARESFTRRMQKRSRRK